MLAHEEVAWSMISLTMSSRPAVHKLDHIGLDNDSVLNFSLRTNVARCMSSVMVMYFVVVESLNQCISEIINFVGTRADVDPFFPESWVLYTKVCHLVDRGFFVFGVISSGCPKMTLHGNG